MENLSSILNEILEAKEKRAKTQRELLNIFRTTLISFTLNIPGAEKNNESFSKVHQIGCCLLEEKLEKQGIKIVHKMINTSAAGSEAFFSIDAAAADVKKVTVSIEENHKLGRLFDFDVFNISGEQISRTQLGLSERKCLLCSENAKVCARSKKHDINVVLNKLYEIINQCLC